MWCHFVLKLNSTRKKKDVSYSVNSTREKKDVSHYFPNSTCFFDVVVYSTPESRGAFAYRLHINCVRRGVY